MLLALCSFFCSSYFIHIIYNNDLIHLQLSSILLITLTIKYHMPDKNNVSMFSCVFLPKLRFSKEKKGREKRIAGKELASKWTKAIKRKKRKTMKRKERELKVACTPGYSSSTLLYFCRRHSLGEKSDVENGSRRRYRRLPAIIEHIASNCNRHSTHQPAFSLSFLFLTGTNKLPSYRRVCVRTLFLL